MLVLVGGIVSGITDHNMFRDGFVKMIKSIRLGILEVFNERFESDLGRVSVLYAEKTEYLAAMIGFRSQYKVSSVAWDRIEVEYLKY